jgi:hypothetical protein
MLADEAAAQAMSEPLTNSVARASESLAVVQAATLNELRARRDALAGWGEAYPGGQTSIRGHELAVKGKSAVLDLEESTKLLYAKINGLEPEFTAFSAKRRSVFARGADGGWVLESESRLEEGSAPINEATGVSPAAMKAALTATGKTTPYAKRIGSQAARITRWWSPTPAASPT